MPAKPSGEVKTKTIHQTQKNGDIYVLERQTIYDPEKKYNKVLSTKLIAKIPKDGKIPVPTRPKRSLAYDSTTISVYSENQNDARYGFNKAHDGLKTIKMLTLYSIDSRQPIAFTKQPGNLPDVISLTNALKQLDALGVNTTEIITDNGYYSEQNFSELLQAGFDFITLAKTSIKWIRPEIDKQMEALDDFRSLCPFDHSTHGVTVCLMHDFEKTRKYANHKSGAGKGSVETFSRRIYLHIYFNLSRQNENKEALRSIYTLIKMCLIEDIIIKTAGNKHQGIA